jgi:polysaccharide pyruvyl transferase WcaK-like protein
MNRRAFVHTSLATALAQMASAKVEGRPARVLLRSSWQTVNIGDIAHTPGVLKLLEQHCPELEVGLWPSTVDNGVREMLAARFPKVKIIEGAAVKEAMKHYDFLLHGSGPYLVAKRDVQRWHKETGKPYGVFGITLARQGSASTKPDSSSALGQAVAVLSGAKFAFFRDSVSLELAKELGCKCPVMEMGPDGAFATDLRDDAKAVAFLEKTGLKEGQFLVCIPRYRYTPYWMVQSKKQPFDPIKDKRNQEMREHDLAPIREAIVQVVKQTELKVLICPEDQTQMTIGKEMLYDKLPEEVKPRVVWRPDYWLTDEALSTYVRSAGMFGCEMHTPIMCIGNGIPAIVCRWAEQTSKGLMWKDIGLGEWLFDLDDESQLKQVVPTVLAMAKDLPAAKAKALEGQKRVQALQKHMCETLVGVL